jgi:hypothetical protein
MTLCAAPIKGAFMRLLLLDYCGVPVTGAGSKVFVSKSFTQVASEAQIEDGEEFFVRTADGEACVNQQDPPTHKRTQLTIDFCQVDPEAVATVLSGRVLAVGSPVVTGAGFALKRGTPTGHFSLEVWQRVAGSGACDPSGAQRWVYNLWPHIGNGRIGAYTIENGVSTLQIIADTFDPSVLWGDGPGPVSWLAPATVEEGDDWLWAISTTPPPTPYCGALPLAA